MSLLNGTWLGKLHCWPEARWGGACRSLKYGHLCLSLQDLISTCHWGKHSSHSCLKSFQILQLLSMLSSAPFLLWGRHNYLWGKMHLILNTWDHLLLKKKKDQKRRCKWRPRTGLGLSPACLLHGKRLCVGRQCGDVVAHVRILGPPKSGFKS